MMVTLELPNAVLLVEEALSDLNAKRVVEVCSLMG